MSDKHHPTAATEKKAAVKTGDTVKLVICHGEPVAATVTAVRESGRLDLKADLNGEELIVNNSPEGETPDCWMR